jgi:hypothetical protein
MKLPIKLCIAALGTAVLIYALKGPFTRWRVRRLEATAESLLKAGDQHGAVLTARTILEIDPGDVAACRIMARSADEDRSPLGLVWRQKLVELQPGEAGPLVDLARTAVGLGESAVAENALNHVPAGGQDTAAYHDAAAAWALSIGQTVAAEKEARQALRFDPANGRLRLSVAALELAAGDPAAAMAARTELEGLQKEAEYREEATRDLLADARKRGDWALAMVLARELDGAPGAKTEDHLFYLEELARAGSTEYEGKLAALRAAAKEPGEIYTIMEWMMGRGMAGRAMAWHRELPAESRKMPELLAAAEACAVQGDWAALREMIEGARWGDLEFLRLAYETRLFDEMSQHERGVDFANRWQRTVYSTGGNTNAIWMLARLARSWGWKEEAKECWWSIANRRMGQEPALAALFETAQQDKDTRELYRVSRRLYEIEPGSPVAKNNVAMFALLLREDLAEAHKLAAEDYTMAPGEPAILSTYAFSLYVQGRAQEAVAVMAKAPTAALEDPSMAACNGVLLMAAGEAAKARPYLELALREKARLLPEEVAMVEQAMGQAKP